jgi:hypothetical protein
MAIGTHHDQCVFLVDALIAISLMAAGFDRALGELVGSLGRFWVNFDRCRAAARYR